MSPPSVLDEFATMSCSTFATTTRTDTVTTSTPVVSTSISVTTGDSSTSVYETTTCQGDACSVLTQTTVIPGELF